MSGDMGFGGFGGRGYGAFSMPMRPRRGGFPGIGGFDRSFSPAISPDYDQTKLFNGIGDPYAKASFRYGEAGGESDYGFPWTQEGYNPNPQQTQPAATQADEGNYQQQQGGPDSGDVAERNPGHHGKSFDQMSVQELRDYMEARNNGNIAQRNIERLNPSGLVGALFGRIEQSQLAAALNAAGLGGMNPGDYVDGKVAGGAGTSLGMSPELMGRNDSSQAGIGEIASEGNAGAWGGSGEKNRRGGTIRRAMGGIGYADGGRKEEEAREKRRRDADRRAFYERNYENGTILPPEVRRRMAISRLEHDDTPVGSRYDGKVPGTRDPGLQLEGPGTEDENVISHERLKPRDMRGLAMGGIGYASGGEEQSDFAVRGIGDGRDDKINALLSDGEHVIPADVVAAFGRGSSKAGHEKLNDMIVKKRAQFKKTLGKLPPPKG